jgi:23S rRNA (adenine2503-C2)-methyltransferase
VHDLLDMTRAELQGFVANLGEPRYRADQLFRWVHGRGADDFGAMTDLSRPLRARLEGVARVAGPELDADLRSRDGARKLRLRLADGALVESVIIPAEADEDEVGDAETGAPGAVTLCISSQVGCALGCRFCATGTLGLRRNLTAGEIVGQVYRARALLAADPSPRRLTNLVYMGMGEPLHNYGELVRSLRILGDELGADLSHRRITVSTAGLVPALERLGREELHVGLAVSLNAASDRIRDAIMPVNKKWGLSALLAAVRAYPLDRRRRVTFEYVLLAGVNDSLDEAARLGTLLAGLPCKLNLIPWNPHPGAPFRRPDPEAVARFQAAVKRTGVPAYLRTTRGDDIAAACGQLAATAATTG